MQGAVHATVLIINKCPATKQVMRPANDCYNFNSINGQNSAKDFAMNCGPAIKINAAILSASNNRA